jgi:hypothetical protein
MLHDAITERVLGAAMKVHSALGAEKLLPLHLAQVLTYLKLSGHRVALLINFNVPHLRDGIRRVMNGMERSEDPGPSK